VLVVVVVAEAVALALGALAALALGSLVAALVAALVAVALAVAAALSVATAAVSSCAVSSATSAVSAPQPTRLAPKMHITAMIASTTIFLMVFFIFSPNPFPSALFSCKLCQSVQVRH
jgi:hypothetical protein